MRGKQRPAQLSRALFFPDTLTRSYGVVARLGDCRGSVSRDAPLSGVCLARESDVHARSTHVGPIDLCDRASAAERVWSRHQHQIDWPGGLPGPIRACYEARPTGSACIALRGAAGIAGRQRLGCVFVTASRRCRSHGIAL